MNNEGLTPLFPQCDYFLTTDDELIKKASGIKEIKVTDPISFIKEEVRE